MLSKSVQRIGSGILHNPLNGKPANNNARRWASGQGKRMSAIIQDFHWQASISYYTCWVNTIPDQIELELAIKNARYRALMQLAKSKNIFPKYRENGAVYGPQFFQKILILKLLEAYRKIYFFSKFDSILKTRII